MFVAARFRSDSAFFAIYSVIIACATVASGTSLFTRCRTWVAVTKDRETLASSHRGSDDANAALLQAGMRRADRMLRLLMISVVLFICEDVPCSALNLYALVKSGCWNDSSMAVAISLSVSLINIGRKSTLPSKIKDNMKIRQRLLELSDKGGRVVTTVFRADVPAALTMSLTVPSRRRGEGGESGGDEVDEEDGGIRFRGADEARQPGGPPVESAT